MTEQELNAYQERLEELLIAQHETMMEDPELYM